MLLNTATGSSQSAASLLCAVIGGVDAGCVFFPGKGMRKSESKGGGADKYECVHTP